MRKYLSPTFVALLATTSTLFGATSPELTISGKSVFAGYGSGQKVTQGKSGGTAVMVEDSAIRFTVNRATDFGLEQKIFFELNGVPSMPVGANPAVMKQVYIQLKGKYGSFWIGNVNSTTKEDSVNGGKIIITGPANYTCKLKNVFNMTSGVLYEDQLVGENYAATKIKYLTPYLSLIHSKGPEVQLGIDFTPNSEHKGDAIMANNRSQSFASQGSIFANNTVSYVAKVRQKVNSDLTTTLGFSGLKGTSRDGRNTTHLGNFRDNDATRHNLRNYFSYNIGGEIDYKDTSFVVAFQNNGRSAIQKHGVSKNITNANYEQFAYGNAGKGYEVALAQTYGSVSGSLAYLNTSKKHAKSQKGHGEIVSANVAYGMAPGISLVAGASYIKQTTSKAGALLTEYEGGRDVNPVVFDEQLINNNRGYVTAAGIAIKF
jgi:hypothetical protein